VSDDLCEMTGAALSRGYACGDFSPVEVAKAVLDRIERLNPAVNAYVFVDADGALGAAHASEARWRGGSPLGPLDGVPASVKELLPAAGWPLRRCSRAMDPVISEEDAPAVARLREQGAVLLGKTNSPEFGWKGVTDNAVFGATGNPYNPTKTAGGSSGGAAAAAALGMGVLHIGTDGGGSIRIPAAFSGLFGLKPSFARVPVHPLSRFASVSHVGPMSWDVLDSAMMLDALARPDSRDCFSLPPAETSFADAAHAGLPGLRVAYAPYLGGARPEPAVAETVNAAACVFESLGAEVEEVDSPISDTSELFRKIWASGVASTIASFPADRHEAMDPDMRRLGEYGRTLHHMEYLEAEYERGLIGAAMGRFHDRYDLMITPAEPIAAFAINAQVAALGEADWIDWTPYTYPFNLTGQPAASVPCGFTPEGLPIGLQIIAARHRDDLVLRAALAYQRAAPTARPRLSSAEAVAAERPR